MQCNLDTAEIMSTREHNLSHDSFELGTWNLRGALHEGYQCWQWDRIVPQGDIVIGHLVILQIGAVVAVLLGSRSTSWAKIEIDILGQPISDWLNGS